MSFLSKIELKLVHAFWFLPPDLHERQRWMASRIKPHQKILDVGGEQRVLGERTQASDYYTINVQSETNQTPQYLKDPEKDLLYDGKHLPFKDASFDVLVCIDVLEHVPPKQRSSLIKEMLRVTKHQLIISAPLGTPAHQQAEKDLYKQLMKVRDVAFLREHIELGLPTPEEVQAWADEHQGKLTYSGDFRLTNALFTLHNWEVSFGPLNHLLFFLKLKIYAVYNFFLYPLMVNRSVVQAHTNRFYLEIRKS